MLKIKRIYPVLFSLLGAFSFSTYAQQSTQGLLTLFTTQQERQLIDNNRYRQPREEQPVVQAVSNSPSQDQQVSYSSQTLSVELNGVTVTDDGKNYAWINGTRVESGDEIEGGAKVFINPKIQNSVRIKTSDGDYHTVLTGEKIEITYMKPVEG
jgi:hypothetical protein